MSKITMRKNKIPRWWYAGFERGFWYGCRGFLRNWFNSYANPLWTIRDKINRLNRVLYRSIEREKITMNKCNAQVSCNNTKPDLFQYYVVRNKDTGCYYRGKGTKNKWGKYYNQASIYRIKKHAENAVKYLDRYEDEKTEIIEISIIENHKSNKTGLYKGKSVEDGKWIEGNLLTLGAKTYILVFNGFEFDGWEMSGKEIYEYEVIPETVVRISQN